MGGKGKVKGEKMEGRQGRNEAREMEDIGKVITVKNYTCRCHVLHKIKTLEHNNEGNRRVGAGALWCQIWYVSWQEPNDDETSQPIHTDSHLCPITSHTMHLTSHSN